MSLDHRSFRNSQKDLKVFFKHCLTNLQQQLTLHVDLKVCRVLCHKATFLRNRWTWRFQMLKCIKLRVRSPIERPTM